MIMQKIILVFERDHSKCNKDATFTWSKLGHVVTDQIQNTLKDLRWCCLSVETRTANSLAHCLAKFGWKIPLHFATEALYFDLH